MKKSKHATQLLTSYRSMQQLGASFSELLIPPPTPNDPYPPLPLEVDDQHIYVSHVDPQPTDVISELTGFNFNIRIYLTCTPLATMEMAYGIDEVFDWNRQRRVLEECLKSVKRTLDTVPRELMLQPGNQVGEFETVYPGLAVQSYWPPTTDLPSARVIRTAGGGGNGRQRAEELHRKWLQYEIQKANVYASQLGTRSYIVEKYWNLLENYNRIKQEPVSSSSSNGRPPGSPGVVAAGLDGMLGGQTQQQGRSEYDVVEPYMSRERENIVKDLLRVLGCISQVNMEPNGGSFVCSFPLILSSSLSSSLSLSLFFPPILTLFPSHSLCPSFSHNIPTNIHTSTDQQDPSNRLHPPRHAPQPQGTPRSQSGGVSRPLLRRADEIGEGQSGGAERRQR